MNVSSQSPIFRGEDKETGREMDNYVPVDRGLSTFHWNLNTDGTGKIAFLGALPWIA